MTLVILIELPEHDVNDCILAGIKVKLDRCLLNISASLRGISLDPNEKSLLPLKNEKATRF